MSLSAKIVLFTSKTLANGEHPIMLRVIKNRKPTYFNLQESCSVDLWDDKNNQPKRKHTNSQALSTFLMKLQSDAQEIILRYKSDNRDLSVQDFEAQLFHKVKNLPLLTFIEQIITGLKKSKKERNAEVYRDCFRALNNFLTDKDKSIGSIDYNFLVNFEQHLRAKELKETSISVYFRTFRAVYNKAILEEIVREENNPFKKFKVSKFDTATRKRALEEDELKKILHFDTSKYPELIDAKNIFIFSFYCRGINFKDIAQLKWKNIKNGQLEYTRSKTGKFFVMELLPTALEVINYYQPFSKGDYIFPILDPNKHISLSSIENRNKRELKKVNIGLKAIAVLVGIDPEKLTTYVARHSWATTMKRRKVDNNVISESMGHSSEKTTKIYLASFENNVLDDANRKALEDL